VAGYDERKLLKRIRNHAEFRSILVELSLARDLAAFDQHVERVTRCWFDLGREHLKDAEAAYHARRTRSVYSRAYYAVYNASKAVRYHVNGVVSLKGDDHKKASDLPGDFPDVAKWTARIPEMYEHRLRADYDNWRLTSQEHVLQPQDCLALAKQFLQECQQYIQTKFGISL